MRVLIHIGEELVRDETFSRVPILVGSGADCGIRLPDQRVADHQCKIYPHAGEAWLIEPLAVGHRTVRNGHVLTEATYVEQGDEIDIAEYSIRLYPELDDMLVGLPATGVVQTIEEVAKIRSHPLPAGSQVFRGDDPMTLEARDHQAVARLAFDLHVANDIPKFLTAVLRFLARRFEGRLTWMAIRRQGYGRLEFVEGYLGTAPTSAEPPLLDTLSYRCLERGQYILVPRAESVTNAEIGSMLAIPIDSRRGRLGWIYVDAAAGQRRLDLPALHMLIAVSMVAAVHLEGIIEQHLKMQEALASGELSFIRQVQSRLDPRNVPHWEGFQLAAYCRHGKQRSGDVYDLMKLPNGMIAIIIAHAQASTTRAALAITEVRAAFRVAGLHADPPHVLLRELNWLLHDTRDPCALSCVSIIINPRTGVCQYCAAGTICAIVVDTSGERRVLADRTAEAIGLAAHPTLSSQISKILPSETLVLYTPGWHTLETPSGESLGESRFVDALRDGFGQSASAALDGLQMDLADYLNSGRQPDDMTVLLLHRVAEVPRQHT